MASSVDLLTEVVNGEEGGDQGSSCLRPLPCFHVDARGHRSSSLGSDSPRWPSYPSAHHLGHTSLSTGDAGSAGMMHPCPRRFLLEGSKTGGGRGGPQLFLHSHRLMLVL